MKKLFAILLALAILFAMSTTAFAAETETVKLEFTGITGHTYYVYQIYKADAHENEDKKIVLSNVVYGKNYYPTGGAAGGEVPSEELKLFQESAKPENFFNTGLKGIDDPYARVNEDKDKDFVELDVEPGYYMIVDKTEDLTDDQTKSPVILCAAGPITIASKHATISSVKKVKDINDSTGDQTDWQKSADYDIGDEVPFRLEVQLPNTLTTYNEYPLVIHDQQAAGFTFPESVRVYIERNSQKLFEVTTGFNVDGNCGNQECDYGAACSFNVAFTNVKALYTGEYSFLKNDVLVVEYTSKLGEDINNDGVYEDVVVGRNGNENSMYVHHPDGHTNESKVTVLTYALTINKIDGDSKTALKGAGFTLFKYDPTNTVEDKYEAIVVGKNAAGEPIYELKGEDLTQFTWSGLDDGKYLLKETTTPDGYNTIADVEFVIEATHKTDWLADGNYALDSVSAKTPDGKHNVYLDVDANGQLDGNLEGNVENYQGVVLPQTGAQGTFFLITGSALLVMVAAVFMITRKKMSIYED